MLINLRNALMAGKRKLTAKDYVQSGLVAMWDGIENAGWGTHDASATTWKDLIGADDLAIGSDTSKAHFTHAALWRDKSFGALLTGNLSWPLTVEMIIDVDSSFTGSANPRFFAFGNDPSVRREFDCYTANAADAPRMFEPSRYGHFGRSSSTGLWALSVSFADDTSVDFRDNICAKSISTTLKSLSAPVKLNIGAWYNTYSAMTGLYYCVRIYSRALTADEIARNYAIDKARFGLP